MWRRETPRGTAEMSRAQEPAEVEVAPEPVTAEVVQPVVIEDRMAVAKAAVAGVLVGVIGTLGVQFSLHLISKVHLGHDGLAYVSNIGGLDGPININDQAMRTRLDRLTGSRWGLLQYADPRRGPVYVPIPNLQPLTANRGALGKHINLPDQSAYPIDKIYTNMLLPADQRRQGQLIMLWFANSFTAQKWLLKGADPIKGSAATTTLWSGDMVVYYAPGEKDQTQEIKEWLTEVTRCPMSADAC